MLGAAASADVPGSKSAGGRKPVARTRCIALSPTNRCWAAASTEGLLLYRCVVWGSSRILLDRRAGLGVGRCQPTRFCWMDHDSCVESRETANGVFDRTPLFISVHSHLAALMTRLYSTQRNSQRTLLPK